MLNYLLQHTYDNVWCNNEQDHQLIFQAHKLTKLIGELNRFKLLRRYISLPETGKRYHVYQIGQISVSALGLLSRQPDWTVEKWFSFQDAINATKLFCNLYTKEGLELPKYKSYYMYTNERALILAIEDDISFNIDYNADALYLRLYSNAYFESVRADALEDYIYCKGAKPATIQQILDLQNEYNTYASKSGYVYSYRNGHLIDRIDLVNVSVGDIVEFIYDSSVKKVVTFTINSLSVFQSELDSKYKYLLHHHDAESPDTIDYQDDIDIHILKMSTTDRYKGVYYHRNNVDSHRMVTHRDYSVVVDYINYIATHLSNGSDDIREFKLEVKIRHSGYERPLIYDANRIFELYKLSDDLILQAMVGVNANVEEWKASNLEKSAYTHIMRAEHRDIDISMIQEAYGYNGISKLVGDTPSKSTLISGLQTVDLPYNLQENATFYEYDIDGKLIGYDYQVSGSQYSTPRTDACLIEGISGRGTNRPNVKFGTDNIVLPDANYRVYMCYVVGGVPNNQWVDITGSEQYTVNNNMLVWSNLETDQFLMVRSDDTFLAYDLEIVLVNGILFFTLAELEDRGDGVLNYELPIPLGDLDLFLNGKSLIKDIDYVLDFPRVYILNKKYLIQPCEFTPQQVHVRFTGFCNSDLTLDAIEDRGFIEHGVLSNNNRFDIRDDKVLRITVDGSVKHRDDLVFSELHQGVSITNPINGLPYQIKDIVVPLRHLVNENTYSLREKSQLTDQHIGDYMSLKLPQPDRSGISAISELYPLVSPFIARVIHDILTGVIPSESIQVQLTNINAMAVCKPYEYLLQIDPISPDRRIDIDFVHMHPTMYGYSITVSVYQYRFIQKVVDIYASGLIQLNHFLAITESGV